MHTWFKFLLSTFLPLVAAFFLPRGFLPYCFAASGVLLIVAVVLMLRQDRRDRAMSSEGE